MQLPFPPGVQRDGLRASWLEARYGPTALVHFFSRISKHPWITAELRTLGSASSPCICVSCVDRYEVLTAEEEAAWRLGG